MVSYALIIGSSLVVGVLLGFVLGLSVRWLFKKTMVAFVREEVERMTVECNEVLVKGQMACDLMVSDHQQKALEVYHTAVDDVRAIRDELKRMTPGVGRGN